MLGAYKSWFYNRILIEKKCDQIRIFLKKNVTVYTKYVTFSEQNNNSVYGKFK